MHRVPIKVGNVTGYVTSPADILAVRKQLDDAEKIIKTPVAIRKPVTVKGYINRDEFYKFMLQMNPREDIRRSDGARIFGALVRGVLSGRSWLDIVCAICGKSIADNCVRKNRIVHYAHTEQYSTEFLISLSSLKAHADQIRHLEGITQARYEKILELIKFA